MGQIFYIILICGSLQGVIFSLVLFSRKKNRYSNRILAILLLCVSIHLFLAASDNEAFWRKFPHLSHITWVLPLVYGPLVLIYFRRLTKQAPLFRYEAMLYFIPFAVFVILELPYFLSDAAGKIEYLTNAELSFQKDFGWKNQGVNFFHILFFVWGLKKYHIHKKNILNYYSDISEVKILWMKQFFIYCIVIVFISLLAFYGKKFALPVVQYIYPFHFLALVTIVYWMGFKAIMQPEIFTEFSALKPIELLPWSTEDRWGISPENEMDEKLEKKETGIRQSEIHQKLAKEMERLMTDEKVYLQPELNLPEFSKMLNTNKQYVSETINVLYQKSFYDYINDYRINEFKELFLKDNGNKYTILALAFESGFNSKSTFYSVFKSKTGLTPSVWCKQNSRGEEVSV